MLVVDSSLYHHHQNTTWWNIFWKNAVQGSNTVPGTCRICAKLQWSFLVVAQHLTKRLCHLSIYRFLKISSFELSCTGCQKASRSQWCSCLYGMNYTKATSLYIHCSKGNVLSKHLPYWCPLSSSVASNWYKIQSKHAAEQPRVKGRKLAASHLIKRLSSGLFLRLFAFSFVFITGFVSWCNSFVIWWELSR